METRCIEVSPQGTSFDRLEAELAELARLSDDGLDVADIRIERSIELAQLEADVGKTETAHEILDELLVDLADRTDREGLVLTIIVRARRAAVFALAGQPEEAADGYGSAYELASEAVTSWKTDRELAVQFVDVARALGQANRALGHHETALAAYDKALIVCRRFPTDASFLRFAANTCADRAHATRSAGKPLAEVLGWFDQAIDHHATFDDPPALAAILHNRGWVQKGDAGLPDYLRAAAVLEPLLPDPNAAASLAKTLHNIALVLRDDKPADALPHQSRAVELMYDVIEHHGSDENRFDLLLYRLGRADVLARSGALTAAIEETRDALPEFEDVITRIQQQRGTNLLEQYRTSLVKWTGELARRTPVAYRTLPPTVAAETELRCTFCKRARSEVSKLISGPRVFICNHCTTAAVAALLPLDTTGPLVECGFCGVDRQRFVSTSDGVICDDCLGLCQDILEEAIAESHPDLRCSFCGSDRAEADRLVLGPDATALCGACFHRARTFLGRHHPYEAARGARRGNREIHLEICGWCASREALAFLHGELLVLCDSCIDRTAQDML